MARSDCHRVVKQLPDYQAGALTGVRRERLDAHLAECEACRRQLKALERTAALLNSTALRKPSRDLWPEIAAQLAPREQRREQWYFWLPVRRTGVAVVAVALLIVIMLAMIMPRHVSHGPTVALEYEADEEAQLFAGWHAETSLLSGASNRYALAFAVAMDTVQREAQ
ncbi:MAG: zf-HC2 domain-containing protein [Candidatus Zipacnadales bacterium]